ncbi:ThiF family adenylyltransferase [Oceanobacillus sp. J11TS1]|uniref:ThiF family adenylyltransferase n=1 Tax=Oceanobacillus sp. J11TS1 TaxID=2807191 RepID=UPI001B29FE58|nr:ThiF family adenylyltransferase [Oceanobacillus sp. J11TS1]GIO23806.1 thiazole biosynthesis adenylyltransferase ThiF [Oceanobacillus sp. J11TS1]
METNRYQRQILFTPIGETGQEKLSRSHVLIVGTGALGSSSAEALARAGVGHLTLIDRDYVEESNLQRQQLFSEEDMRQKTPKAIAAKQRLSQVNSHIHIDAIVGDAEIDLLRQIAPKVDLIIDATDNFETRLLLNDTAQKYQKPWIYGAVVASYGVTFTVLPDKTPCLQCLAEYIPNNGATCDSVGIIQPVVQKVVSQQVTEALKLLTGNEAALSGKLIAFDLWENQHTEIEVASLRKADCPSCSEKRSYPNLAYDARLKTAVLCGRNTVQLRPQRKKTDLAEVAKELQKNNQIKLFQNPYLLSFEVDSFRVVLFQDGRVLIHGTMDQLEAKTIYHRYLG